MLDSLVNRDAATERKNQDSDDEAPEIYFLAVTERKIFVRRFGSAFHAV